MAEDSGNDPGTVRPLAQSLNHYATPGPNINHLQTRSLAECNAVGKGIVSKCKSQFRTLKMEDVCSSGKFVTPYIII